jgi:glutathione S-transferase
MTGEHEYTLYCYRNSYAMIAHAILEEIGATYDLRWVPIFTDTPDPEFAAISPHQRVPALTGPDGVILETGAIALYLAERHPQVDLVIAPSDSRRGQFLQWLHYLASTLQPEVNIQYHPENYFDDAADQGRLRQASMTRLERVLDVIEEALSPGPFFFGEDRTICDYVLAMQAVWPPIYPRSIDDYPNIKRLTKTITDREPVRKALIMHEETWAGV